MVIKKNCYYLRAGGIYVPSASGKVQHCQKLPTMHAVPLPKRNALLLVIFRDFNSSNVTSVSKDSFLFLDVGAISEGIKPALEAKVFISVFGSLKPLSSKGTFNLFL